MTARKIASLALMFGAFAWAQSTGQRTFPTPEAAVNALVKSVKAAQQDQTLAMLGPEMKDAMKSQDPDLLKLERDLFLLAAERGVKIEADEANKDRAIAYFGELEWPFPAPLVKQGQSWRFDSVAGRQELTDRAIGRNELAAVAACTGYVSAQMEYASDDWDDDGILEYAQKLVSSRGKKDGLYWSNDQGDSLSPLGPFFAQAAGPVGNDENLKPFAGYYFKILTRQGSAARGGVRDYFVDGNLVLGFALVAWPAEYGQSGISTFIVNQMGHVFEKDLGQQTASLAKAIQDFNPDSSWKKAEED